MPLSKAGSVAGPIVGSAMGIDSPRRFAVAQGPGPQHADRNITTQLVRDDQSAKNVCQAPGCFCPNSRSS
jgi:hypothetical protein